MKFDFLGKVFEGKTALEILDKYPQIYSDIHKTPTELLMEKSNLLDIADEALNNEEISLEMRINIAEGALERIKEIDRILTILNVQK